MLQAASAFYKFDTPIRDVAAIWRSGCIIRSAMLEDFMQAFTNDDKLTNLMLTPEFSQQLAEALPALKKLLVASVEANIPVPAFSAIYNYYISFHSSWLPANLVQAQRDFFGAHTYERTDQPGNFHNIWAETIQ